MSSWSLLLLLVGLCHANLFSRRKFLLTPCERDGDCTKDEFCRKPYPTETGECLERPRHLNVGKVCRMDFECAPGEFCEGSSGDGKCAVGSRGDLSQFDGCSFDTDCGPLKHCWEGNCRMEDYPAPNPLNSPYWLPEEYPMGN